MSDVDVKSSTKRALVVGGSGLVGRELVRRLASDATYDRVTVLARKPFVGELLGTDTLAPHRVREVLVDFDQPASWTAELKVDDVFCCLGTTIKQAGSQEAFRRVDHDLPLLVAEGSLAAGAQRYLIVTAVGADAKSRIFYNRVKGQLEESLRALPFPRGVKILHPSMLLGQRPAHDTRSAEGGIGAVMKALSPIFSGPLKKYRAIAAGDVANAMAHVAHDADPSTRAYEGQALFDAAAATH